MEARIKEVNNTLLDPRFKVFAEEISEAFKYESSRIARILDKPEPLTEMEVRALDFHKAKRACYAHILGVKRSLEDELSNFLEETSSETADVKEPVEQE